MDLASADPRPLAYDVAIYDLLVRARRHAWAVCQASEATDRDAWLRILGAPTAIAEARLEAMEAELDMRVPDALIAVLAARLPLLEGRLGITLENMPEFANQAWATFSLERRLVAFGDAPLALDGSLFSCFQADQVGDEDPEIIELICAMGAFPKASSLRLSQWLVERLDAGQGLGKDALDVDPDGLAPFEPRVLAPAPRPLRTVVHPSWGSGVVVAERGDRLVVEFAEHGQRKVLRRFVEDR